MCLVKKDTVYKTDWVTLFYEFAGETPNMAGTITADYI
jgi:hypothetical protein